MPELLHHKQRFAKAAPIDVDIAWLVCVRMLQVSSRGLSCVGSLDTSSPLASVTSPSIHFTMRVYLMNLEHRVPKTYDNTQIKSYIPHIISDMTRQKDNMPDQVVDPTIKSCCSLLLRSLQALSQLVLVQDSNNSKKAVVNQCIVQWATLLVHLMHSIAF